MCGITGAVWSDPRRAVDSAALQRMTDMLRHRGPDDEGFHSQTVESRQGPVSVALGHRRLAVLDPAGSRQPMTNEDGTLWLVFNGEIYNYRELRANLQQRGHRLRTDGDTEVIVHLYEDEGLRFVEQLNGMFALALWDARHAQLVLARDRLGEKPLVYCHQPGRLVFGSELKSLLALPDVPRQLDPQAVDQYLTYQYVPAPRTIFAGIGKLSPGQMLIYHDDRVETRSYWNPDFHIAVDRPIDEHIERVRALAESSVALRMQSDVPLGAFLSGGVDSTIVVGLMRRQTTGTVRTFSIGFSAADFDETAYAREVAERFETEHEEFRVEPDAVAILPKLVWHYDEPMADSSAVPTWYLSELTRRRVTVALTGDGGDELFAGYDRYRAVWLASLIDRAPALVGNLLAGRFWQRLPHSARQQSLLRRFRRFSGGLALPPARRYLEWISIFGEARRAELYRPDFLKALPDADPLLPLAQALRRTAGRSPVTTVSLADLLTYLPGDLMTKVDIASMAHGLETRPPFLDHRLVELAARIPQRQKFSGGRGKLILKQAFADLLPASVARRRKMGFGVPLAQWFRGPLREFAAERLFDPRTVTRPYFEPSTVRQLWDEHQQGRFDHAYRLWALLVFELWHRQWLDETVAA